MAGTASASQRDLTGYVMPVIGSKNEFQLSNGNVYPCFARPWGMNHWTAQTAPNGDRWQYGYDDKHIVALKQTHQPSPWVGDYGMYSFMATTGDKVFLEEDRKSWFSHKTETMLPHYYKVYLADSFTHAEMTASARGAILRFTFPECDRSNIIIDAFDDGSWVKVIPSENKIIGYSTQSYGYDERKPDNFRNYFVVVFDKPFDSYSVWCDGSFTDGNIADEQRTGAVVTFSTGGTEQVTLRTASSFISPEQAELNLANEIGAKTFDELEAEGRAEWNSHLNRFRVSDAGLDDLDNVRMFYSCLYRILLYPREFHEYGTDGKPYHYSPYNGHIESGRRRMYTDNGFWDTFRAVHPFFNLFYPELSGHIMEGLANTYKESRWLPEWASPGHLGDAMIGSNSTSLVASAYLNGVTGMDTDTLWEAVMKSSGNAHPEYLSVGRAGADYYNTLGYVPYDVGIKENAARTLEYAYADFCIYKLAEALGKDKKTLRTYARRALNYRNLYNPEAGLMAGRDSQGNFRPDFDPYAWGGDFTEGCSLHYTWSVFHDPHGLAALMGGYEKFTSALDKVFATPPVFSDDAYGFVIHEMREMQIVDFGQYAHGNQPIQHMIYLYDWAGQPWKTQYWVWQVMDRLYRPTPDGYCGDEDNGQTSAWYVFSALGLYPVCPATSEYAIGSPMFRHVELTIPDGRTTTISAEKNIRENVYIQEAMLNGKKFSRNYLTTYELQSGADIRFIMGAAPQLSCGTDISDAPYSFSLEVKTKYP